MLQSDYVFLRDEMGLIIMTTTKKGNGSAKAWFAPGTLSSRILKHWQIYLILLPGLLWYTVFAYIPMYGLTLAFRTYRADLGIWGSPWVGLANYEFVFRDPQFFRAVRNTFEISIQRLIFQFPVPIIIALLLNEVNRSGYKRFLQTIFTFPNFLSWVIVASITLNLLGSAGYVNSALIALGAEPVNFLGNSNLFRPMLYITENWRSAGWGAIIYMAAISGIDMEQYESATVDGASRFQKMIYITLPGIKATIVVLFILAVGGIMNGGFDQIFNLGNPAVRDVSDILDTYIYRITFQAAADFSFSTAIALFRSVVNFMFLIVCDRLARIVGEHGLFG